jgi:hypothetical protein
MIYFDNAATSWPKPPGVAEAMTHFIKEVGANPGRAAHRQALESGRIVYNAREAVCELFHAPDPLRLVWCKNVTEALNLALRGLLRPGDHVVTSSMEHNAMMRPLRALEGQPEHGSGGVEVTVVGCSPQGVLGPAAVEAAIRPNTRLVALNHASNVVGTLLPVVEVGALCRQYAFLPIRDNWGSSSSLCQYNASKQSRRGFVFTPTSWVQWWLLRARPMAARASTVTGMRVVYDKEGTDPCQRDAHYRIRVYQRRRVRIASGLWKVAGGAGATCPYQPVPTQPHWRGCLSRT